MQIDKDRVHEVVAQRYEDTKCGPVPVCVGAMIAAGFDEIVRQINDAEAEQNELRVKLAAPLIDLK